MAETTTLTLTGFLLARIAEDKARALGDIDHFGDTPDPRDQYITQQAARVLAECEAKRRIVALLTDSGRVTWDRMALANRDVLAHLALPYADHPSYDEGWRP